MRARTRITAWIVVILGIVGATSMWSGPAGSKADRIFLMACGVIAVALWSAILARQRWARNTLLAVLVVQFAGAIHNAAGMPAAHQKSVAFFWAGLLVMSSLVYGWQAFVLLTENPANWPIREQVKRHD